jgi:hypothetical protein
MDLRLYCNGLTRVDNHTQVDFAFSVPFGQHHLRLLLSPDEAAKSFKAGNWYDVTVNPSTPKASAPAPAPEPEEATE